MTEPEDILSITRHAYQEGELLSVAGELDVSTAPRLREELQRAVREGRGEVVVDLSGLSFIDSTGVGVLVEAHTTLGDARRLVLRSPSRQVMRVLGVLGLTGVLHLNPPLPD